jgi:hypothetical protein
VNVQAAASNGVPSDVLIMSFADNVMIIFDAKSTGSRYAREASSTAQVALAGIIGASSAFKLGARTIAGLGIGAAGIPELQRIFDARGRADTYEEAANQIRIGIGEYLAFNGPATNELTPNGVTLYKRVIANIHLVEKTINGHLPTPQDMAQAIEEMSTKGATPHQPGESPPNNTSVNSTVVSALNRNVRQPDTVSHTEFEKLKADHDRMKAALQQNVSFVTLIRKVHNGPLKDSENEIYTQVIKGAKDAGFTGNVEPTANALISFFQDTATQEEKAILTQAANKIIK